MIKIKNTNEEFKKATKAQKRVMIAKDVLAQIKAKRYIPEAGTWVDINYNHFGSEMQIGEECSVQELFSEKTIESCQVCALGGLFMSCINLNNSTLFKELDEAANCLGDWIAKNLKLSNNLNTIFSRDQLILIELYHEGGSGYFRSSDNLKAKYKHYNLFYTFYPNDEERLKLIMENIVENEGTFKPTKLKT
jgi:hypothetical protein